MDLYKWNLEYIQNKYFDNPDKMLKEAGIHLNKESVYKTQNGSCPICLEVVDDY